MDPIINLLVQLGVGGGALAVLKWFAGRVLDSFEKRCSATNEAVCRIEPKVNEMHARICPTQPPCLWRPDDPDPGDSNRGA